MLQPMKRRERFQNDKFASKIKNVKNVQKTNLKEH